MAIQRDGASDVKLEYGITGEERLRGYEYEAMLDWLGILTMIKNDALDKRLGGIKGAPRMLNTCRTFMGKLIDIVLATMPRDQLLRLQKSIPQIRIQTSVIVPPRSQSDRTSGAFLNFDELNALTEAAHEHCLGCMLDKHGAKKCQIRRIWDELDLIKDKSQTAECPYRSI